MAKEKRLGRGLEALLNRVSTATNAADNVSLPQNPLQAGLSGNAGAQLNPASASGINAPSVIVPVQKTIRPDETERKAVKPEKTEIPAVQDFDKRTNAPTENSDDFQPETLGSSVETDEQTETVYYLNIDDIDANPHQPRQDFNADEINQLADSLNEHGLLQALVVRQKSDDRYELVYGERRLRAAIQVGWQQIPAMVIEATDGEMADLSLVENLHRKDLNAMEKAVSFENCLRLHKCTQEELSRRLKLDRSTVANLIRLLDLPDKIQQMVRQGDLSATHARALLPLGDEKLQEQFAERIVREQLSSHSVEEMIREFLDQENRSGNDLTDSKPQKPAASQKHLADLEKQFLMKTGMKVKLSQSAGGRGKLTINFKSHEQFELIQNILMSADYPVSEKESRKKAA